MSAMSAWHYKLGESSHTGSHLYIYATPTLLFNRGADALIGYRPKFNKQILPLSYLNIRIIGIEC